MVTCRYSQSVGERSVTELLHDWRDGDRAALDSLMPLVYRQLHLMAEQHLRKEREGHTLEPAALVHEAYVRLIDQQRVNWNDRMHFFAVSAQLMRRILVDHSRRRQAEKRGAGAATISIEPGMDFVDTRSVSIVEIDDALTSLAAIDPKQSELVELRFFGGLSIEETAEVLSISPTSVKREWRLARAWLLRELERR